LSGCACGKLKEKDMTYELSLDEASDALTSLRHEAGVEAVRVYKHPRLGFLRSVPRAKGTSQELFEFEEEIIGGSDDRKAILDTTKVPFRWICHLELNFGPDPNNPGNDITARGSGTLIGARYVLTAGHNLFDYDSDVGKKLDVRSVKVTPGYNCAGKRAAPFGQALAASWRTHPQWKPSMNRNFDVGLIKLNAAIGERKQPLLGNQALGYWGHPSLGAHTRINPINPSKFDLKGKKINVSGYPGDKCCFRKYDGSTDCRDSLWAGAQFWALGSVVKVMPPAAPGILLYDADTFGGHSGSPVWLRWENFRNLIAVHTGPGDVISGEPADSSNRGVFLTQKLWQEIRSWI
jgi:V8-like Glu-specific endopeptidase